MKKVEISPSILSADFKNLDHDIRDVMGAGVSVIHFDVMDGKFVNNISFGLPVLKSLKEGNYPVLYDVHLMIENPYKYVRDFFDAGADILTVHYEACSKQKIINICRLAHKINKKVGVSIKPGTSVLAIKSLLREVDLVLVMSVEPGFGGQGFIQSSLKKIEWLSTFREKKDYKFLIEVDGGINDVTGKKCVEAGADMLVAGSYIFKAQNKKEAIFKLLR